MCLPIVTTFQPHIHHQKNIADNIVFQNLKIVTTIDKIRFLETTRWTIFSKMPKYSVDNSIIIHNTCILYTAWTSNTFTHSHHSPATDASIGPWSPNLHLGAAEKSYAIHPTQQTGCHLCLSCTVIEQKISYMYLLGYHYFSCASNSNRIPKKLKR